MTVRGWRAWAKLKLAKRGWIGGNRRTITARVAAPCERLRLIKGGVYATRPQRRLRGFSDLKWGVKGARYTDQKLRRRPESTRAWRINCAMVRVSCRESVQPILGLHCGNVRVRNQMRWKNDGTSTAPNSNLLYGVWIGGQPQDNKHKKNRISNVTNL